MSLLIDFVYQGSCELENLDDVFPLIEVADRYQINKIPFFHVFSEFVLTQLDSSNYLTLLPKFSSVMSEEGNRKAAKMVMCYTNSDFIADFDNTKDLPEKVLLHLLQMDITNHEVDVFDFLVKWHEYQTKDLGQSLQLTSQLFQHMRYSMIIPQILSSRVVARCDLVSKQLLGDAYHYIYNSCNPLGKYESTECSHEPIGPSSRKPKHSLIIEWFPRHNITVQCDQSDKFTISSAMVPINNYIVKSSPLRDGIYSFSVLSINTYSHHYRACYSGAPVSVAVSSQQSQDDNFLFSYPLASNHLITVYVHDKYLFLKIIEGNNVKSTTSMYGTDLFRICICYRIQDTSYNCSFSIHNHVQ